MMFAQCLPAAAKESLPVEICTVQSLCKSLREKVRAQPPEKYHHELLLPITPPAMGKTTHRKLSPVEKGMIIAFFLVFRKISIVSLITGRPWSAIKSFL